jgi:hypothetical protein
VGPRADLDAVEQKRNFFPSGIEPRLFSPDPAAIPTGLSRLHDFVVHRDTKIKKEFKINAPNNGITNRV